MENLEKSYLYFIKSQKLKDNFAPTYYNLGIIKNNLNRRQESINYFKKAVELNPNYTEAFFSLGITYREMKKFDLSKEAFLKALELDQSYPYLKGAIRFIKNSMCDWENYEEDIINLETDIKNNRKVVTPWQGLSLFSHRKFNLKIHFCFLKRKLLN